jgi:predicted DCC family thiol-disulfide oxidoreductase YuxK
MSGKIEAEKKVILFDGVCGLCNKSVDFLIHRDTGKRFLFSPLQGKFAREQVPEDTENLDTIVYWENGTVFRRSSAVLRILTQLGGTWVLLLPFLLIPPFLRDLVYRFVACIRYRVASKQETCRIPTPEEKDRFLE